MCVSPETWKMNYIKLSKSLRDRYRREGHEEFSGKENYICKGSDPGTHVEHSKAESNSSGLHSVDKVMERDLWNCYRETPVGLGLPAAVSSNEDRVESYKAFTEKTIQPRRQSAYKHANPVFQQSAGDRTIKGEGLG